MPSHERLTCLFEGIAGDWTCRWCGVRRKSRNPPVRVCPAAPQLAPAAARLGISAGDIIHYAAALARWIATGFPARDQAEVVRIERELCRPCDSYADGRCRECGCRVTASAVAVANKIKMATESCPLKKW